MSYFQKVLITLTGVILTLGTIGCSGEKLPNLQTSRSDNSRTLVFGSLFNLDSGQFVQGARIQISPGFSEIQSDEDGNFFLDSLGRGFFRLSVSTGTYTTSVEVNTLLTDVVSVNITLGTTHRGSEDFSYLQSGVKYLGKKLLDDRDSQFYDDILQNASDCQTSSLPSFEELGTLDWNPRIADEVIFSAKERLEPFRHIYKYNLQSQCLTTLVTDSFDATEPSYSPDGSRFAYLINNEITVGSVDPDNTRRQKLIRDGKLTLRDHNGRLVLRLDQLNEQNDRASTLLPIPVFGAAGNNITVTNQTAIQGSFYQNLLNEYFNYVCVKSLPQFPCSNTFLHIFDQGIFDDNLMTNATNPTLVQGTGGFFSNGYGGVSNSPTNYSNTLFFDAMNAPAECEMIFSQPRWSPSGNQIAFIAKPNGCSEVQPTVCKRTCDDSEQELFVAPIDIDRDFLLKQGIAYKLEDLERLDKLSVMQITNDIFQDLNPSWDPRSKLLLYDKVKVKNGLERFYLYSSNPTPEGYLTTLLLREDEVGHHAQIAPDGKRILWVRREKTSLNPFGFSQVILSDWSGIISNDRQVTFHSFETAITTLRFYKLVPSAFQANSFLN